MNNFRVGQKVVCIDDSTDSSVKRGNVYTVTETFDAWSRSLKKRGQGLRLEGVIPPIGFTGHSSDYFRPAVDKKTDISIFKEMLKTKELC